MNRELAAASTGFLLSVSLCLDLGLVNLAVLRTVVRQGGLAGFLLSAGSCVGDLIYLGAAVFGAAAALEWLPVRWALWIFGTVTLLVLAWRMVREVLNPKQLQMRDGAMVHGRLFVTGIGLALASPSAILWFAAVGGSVIAPFGREREALTAFTAGFFLGGLAWAVFFSWGAAWLIRVTRGRLVQFMSLASAVLFLYFAVTVFVRGWRELVIYSDRL